MLNFPTPSREQSRYLIVGAACAAVSNTILIAGDAAGLHYSVSIVLSFLFVLPASYVAHAWWTFKAHVSLRGFSRFIGGSVSSLVIASLAVGTFRGLIALPMVVAAPLATLVMTIYNYLMAKWAVTSGTTRPLRSTPKLDPNDGAETA